jgi:hypothetical protein
LGSNWKGPRLPFSVGEISQPDDKSGPQSAFLSCTESFQA